MRDFDNALNPETTSHDIALVQLGGRKQRISPGKCTEAIRSRGWADRQGAAEQQVGRRAARRQLQSTDWVARPKATSRSLRRQC